MKDKYYETKTMKEDLTKELNRINGLVKAWQGVTYPTKKDGTPFQNISKNVEGARLHPWRCALQPGENVVEVSTYVNGCGYISDTVYAYCLVKDIPEGDPKKEKTQNHQQKITYLNQVYTFDVDDIKKAIADRITYYLGQADDIKKQIEAAEKAYQTFKAEYEKLRAKLDKMTVFEHGNKELRRAILNSIQTNY